MKNKLQGKVAVITGASRGIGLAIARAIVREGGIVYDISRHFEANPEMKKSYIADVNDGVAIEKILETIFAEEGKIDIFVNNAGFGIAGAIENSKKESIYSLVDTNLAAVINLSRIALKYLKESKGRLVNTSSVGGIIPLPYQAVYSATKAGVEIFSRALANEVKASGVKVTAIMPGDTKTTFTSSRTIENNAQNEEDRARIEKAIKKAEKEEQNGMSADCVAKVVLKVLKKKNPPLRKTVGVSYKFIVFATRIVPTKFLNWLVRKIYI